MPINDSAASGWGDPVVRSHRFSHYPLMLCIKGFAAPLQYLLSLLALGPAQLPGRVRLDGCTQRQCRGEKTVLGQYLEARSLEYFLDCSSDCAQTNKDSAGSPGYAPRADVQSIASWSRSCHCSQILSPLPHFQSGLTHSQPAPWWPLCLHDPPLQWPTADFLLVPSVSTKSPRSIPWLYLLLVLFVR